MAHFLLKTRLEKTIAGLGTDLPPVSQHPIVLRKAFNRHHCDAAILQQLLLTPSRSCVACFCTRADACSEEVHHHPQAKHIEHLPAQPHLNQVRPCREKSAGGGAVWGNPEVWWCSLVQSKWGWGQSSLGCPPCPLAGLCHTVPYAAIIDCDGWISVAMFVGSRSGHRKAEETKKGH